MLNLLKQTAATAQATATEDQASSHAGQDKIQRTNFDLDITESPPTGDQLRTILEYAGGKKPEMFVTGASSTSDAMTKLKESADAFRRPVVSVHACFQALTMALIMKPRLSTGQRAKQVSTMSFLIFFDGSG